ncbi:glycosyltransferase [Pseudoduganella sp. LjRoot289]|uniref:glycosyltransferase family 2 protein n=1 Tax=Pseudoduganella sp. LjRoot289 TaxID=3342314 RepID=UPI003ECE7B22
MQKPVLSVIMPVFNTGHFLSEAVYSVLAQQALPGFDLPDFELIVVDDHSTDSVTLAILAEIDADPRVRVLGNTRSKGAAGARNTGIDGARGDWIGFLDSDDVWFPNALALRWQIISQQPAARWVGARFQLLRPRANQAGSSGYDDVQTLMATAAVPAAPPAARCLSRPVAEFADSCMVGIMTVMIRKDLLTSKGCFNEDLPRSEDYHLWFQCALDNDLWLLPAEIAYYRIHAASLTHGDAPRLLHEDRMLDLLMRSPGWLVHRSLLLARYDVVMQEHCYFYRGRGRHGSAARSAWRWLRRRPLAVPAWKELLASALRRG